MLLCTTKIRVTGHIAAHPETQHHTGGDETQTFPLLVQDRLADGSMSSTIYMVHSYKAFGKDIRDSVRKGDHIYLDGMICSPQIDGDHKAALKVSAHELRRLSSPETIARDQRLAERISAMGGDYAQR